MNDFGLGDGIGVTIVAMVTVFAILAALWGLTEAVHLLVVRMGLDLAPKAVTPASEASNLLPDQERQTVAVLAALIEAHRENPGEKYEVTEVTRVK